VKKIPCLFQRDFSDRRSPMLLRDVTLGCEWVLAGEGTATVKHDGTACAVISGKLYARLDCKRGKTPPPGAIPCDDSPDPVTGHWPHWVLADRPEHVYIREAAAGKELADGTYEACGPKINGNRMGLSEHVLTLHGVVEIRDEPRDFDGLRDWLKETAVEGLVFHHPDGRMAKIRRDDYGFPWPVEGPTK
jgi:hypothetical protein